MDKCPMCGGDPARVAYGMVAMTDELKKKMKRGKVALGGCTIFPESPKWVCNKCGYGWGKLER